MHGTFSLHKRFFIVGVLRLIGYRSLTKKKSLADDAPAVRGLARHSVALAPSQSLCGAGEIIIMLKVKYNSYFFIK